MASRENYFADIDDKFFVDPSNFQGHQYSQYKIFLMSVALTKPSEYYKLQSDVIEQLNVQIAKLVYKQLFLLLTKGILPDKQPMKIDGKPINPAIPSQAAADFCIDAANTIDKIIRDATEVILPASHLDVAKMQMEHKSKTNTIS